MKNDESSAEGEIVEVTGDTITIRGMFSPGLGVRLHPGARVLVAREDEVYGGSQL